MRLEDSPICIIRNHLPKLNIWNKQYTMPMRNTETHTSFDSILNTAQGQQNGMMQWFRDSGLLVSVRLGYFSNTGSGKVTVF